MAFKQYLNFERVAIEIIEAEIAQMTDVNYKKAGGVTDLNDEENFLINLHHGAIAITFIAALYESTLNDMLYATLKDSSGKDNVCLNDDFKRMFMKKEHTCHLGKIKNICEILQKVSSGIKFENSTEYKIVDELVNCRNALIHYKSSDQNFGELGTHLYTFYENNTVFQELFTKKKITYYYETVVSFIKMICEECGFSVFFDCYVFGGGRCDFEKSDYFIIKNHSEENNNDYN